MTLKLALRNIRRTIGNYAVFFVTLVLGVAIFYAFNSIESQQVLLDIGERDADIFEQTQFMLSLVSYAVAFVLGFLVVYANRFLIRRRKREFGTYLVLGMPPSKVAFIVLVETVAVGVVSLIVGLALGIFMSQGLAFATAALFGTTISDYHFVMSNEAVALTLACFAVIYVVVAVFNVFSVSRFRLIDLLHAEQRAERTPVRNPWVCLVVFVAAIAMIAYAYVLLEEDGMVELGSPLFVRSTVFMLIGSLAFFWSLAGFLVGLLSRLNGVYLRGLVPFTVRQFAARINTAWVTLWTTCIMLFFAVTIFSTGMGLVDVFVGNIERATPYDATFAADSYFASSASAEAKGGSYYSIGEDDLSSTRALAEEYDFDVQAFLEEKVPGWSDLVKESAECDLYMLDDMLYSDLLDAAGFEWRGGLLSGADGMGVLVVSLGQYNDCLALAGEEPLHLGEGEYAIDNTVSGSDDAVDAVIDTGVRLDVAGFELEPVSEKQSLNLQNSAMDSAVLVFVVPDAVVDAMKSEGALPHTSFVNAVYVTPGSDTDRRIEEGLAIALPVTPDGLPASVVDKLGPTEWSHAPWPVQAMYSQADMRQQAGGLRMMITYLALYIGFVLLIATAAILAIQQLTESVDSLPRYRMLWRLGCDERMLFRSLFAQVLVYFLAPLVLALCHSACAICVLSETLFSALGGQNVLGPISMAAGFTLGIYGCYFLVTYFVSRRIVKGGLHGREA